MLYNTERAFHLPSAYHMDQGVTETAETLKIRIKKAPAGFPAEAFWKLGYKDSNLEMTESESVALPFGDSPLINALSIID